MAKQEIIITLAQPSDTEKIIGLVRGVFQETYQDVTPALTEAVVREHYASAKFKNAIRKNLEFTSDRIHLVARLPDTGEIVAYARGKIDDEGNNWMDSCAVDPLYRRRGIANKLHDERMDWFRRTNPKDTVYLIVVPGTLAREIHMKRGFTPTGEITTFPLSNGVPLPQEKMILPTVARRTTQ